MNNSMIGKEKILSNISKIKEEINNICKKISRNPSSIKIIAATKYANAEQIQILVNNGINNLGENKADDLVYKSSIVKGNPIWHFIGHLQSNKVKKVVPLVEYIHSIDNLKTLEKINNFAASINKVQKVLIEVNVSNEETKFGIKLEEVIDFIANALKYGNINICGLMTMAPLTDDYDFIRNVFKNLRIKLEESNNYFKSLNLNVNLTELSMGMSNDYLLAIQEGSTMVRIGSAFFK